MSIPTQIRNGLHNSNLEKIELLSEPSSAKFAKKRLSRKVQDTYINLQKGGGPNPNSGVTIQTKTLLRY